jgi:hypothetical protein
MSDFYKYFKENMDGLNLPAPESLFATVQLAVSTTLGYLAHLDKFGLRVTVGEMVGAGTKAEKMGVIAALSASYYVGAVIGSIAVATGRTIAGGTSLSDVLLAANLHGINRSWLVPTFNRWPQLLSSNGLAGHLTQFGVPKR